MAGRWTGGVVESDRGEEPPTVDEWVPTPVPGRSDRFAGADGPIAYRTRFEDPRRRDDERTFLELRGAYDEVRVWVNDDYLGSDETYVLPSRFEFSPRSENELLVVCDRPESFRGVYATEAVPDGFDVPGIWWGIDLQIRPPTFVAELAIEPRVDGAHGGGGEVEDATATIEATLTVDAGEPIDDAVTLSLRPEGFRGGGSMQRARVSADAGDRVTVTEALEVREPSLWWPRGYGPQNRYTVRAKLGGDSIERTVGLRTVERDADGLLVNGERVRARGLTRLPAGDEREDVRLAIDANATLVRTRQHVPSHEFFEACDEAGLLVWTELPTGGPDLDVDRGAELARGVAREYGHHPSVALYGVQPEPVEPFATPIGSGLLARLSVRYRAWRCGFDRANAEAVSAAVPDGLPTLPVVGALGIAPDAAVLSPGWRYLDVRDLEWLLDRYPGLASAVAIEGAGSLADAPGTNATPQTTVPGLDASLLERRADGDEESRRYQRRIAKTAAETLRRRGVGMFSVGTLRDVAPGGGMGVVAENGDPKPAYDGLSASYEPVQAVLDGPPAAGTIGVTLVNDTTDRVDATVSWTAGDRRGDLSGSADPLSAASIGDLLVDREADRIVLELSIGDRSVRNEYRL